MTEPLSPEREREIRAAVAAYLHHPDTGFACCSAHQAADGARELLAEVARLRDELAEVRASRDPRLRCLLIKAAKDQDTYVGWSTNSEAPTGVWSRQTALEYGFPASRLDGADANGSSSTGPRIGYWDHEALIAEQRGLLPRARLADYAIEYLYGDRIAAYALLEPLEGETEVRR